MGDESVAAGGNGGEAATPEDTSWFPLPGEGPASFLSLLPTSLVIPAVALDSRREATAVNGWMQGEGGRA